MSMIEKTIVVKTMIKSAKLKSAKLMRREFFDRDPRVVSRELLGKLIVRHEENKTLAGRVVEVEAYLGVGDLAAHAAAGETERNAVLWGPPGHAYIYFIYGMHFCLNISCLPEGEAGGVLIRALEPVAGGATMARRRGVPADAPRLASGPGNVTRALGLSLRDNGADLTRGRLTLEPPDAPRAFRVASGPRVGITRARELRLRFWVAGNRFVSR